MESMRSTWTDSRLDGLNERVDGLNDRVDGLSERVDGLNNRVDVLSSRVDDVAHRMDAGFTRVDKDIREMRAEMNARFDSLQMGMLRFGGALVVSVVVTLLAFVLGAH